MFETYKVISETYLFYYSFFSLRLLFEDRTRVHVAIVCGLGAICIVLFYYRFILLSILLGKHIDACIDMCINLEFGLFGHVAQRAKHLIWHRGQSTKNKKTF